MCCLPWLRETFALFGNIQQPAQDVWLEAARTLAGGSTCSSVQQNSMLRQAVAGSSPCERAYDTERSSCQQDRWTHQVQLVGSNMSSESNRWVSRYGHVSPCACVCHSLCQWSGRGVHSRAAKQHTAHNRNCFVASALQIRGSASPHNGSAQLAASSQQTAQQDSVGSVGPHPSVDIQQWIGWEWRLVQRR